MAFYTLWRGCFTTAGRRVFWWRIATSSLSMLFTFLDLLLCFWSWWHSPTFPSFPLSRCLFPDTFVTFATLIQRFSVFSQGFTLMTFATQKFCLFYLTTLACWKSYWLISTFKYISFFNNLFKTLLANKFWCNDCDTADIKRYNFALLALCSDKIWKRMKNRDPVWSCDNRFTERSIRPTDTLETKIGISIKMQNNYNLIGWNSVHISGIFNWYNANINGM